MRAPDRSADADRPAVVDGSIHLAGVHKTYITGPRRVQALRGVDLDIDEPGFDAIMGPSGSGKSTLLHLLAALDQPDEGAIRVAGVELTKLDEKALTDFRRRKIGIVFQQFNLMPTLDALQNAALPGMLDGMPRADRERRATELLEALGLGERLDHRPDALSGGEQQRVAIARALLFSPAVLFADEPTGNLDSVSSEQVWSLLSRIAQERQMTVLMVTHEPIAATHCRRVFLMRDGRIEGSLETEGLDAAQLATRLQQSRG